MNKLVSVKAPPSKTLLLIIFTLANNWCVAQTNFLKGYYVTRYRWFTIAGKPGALD